MSLDFYIECPHCGHAMFQANITHNLNTMAAKAGLYEALWRPTEEQTPGDLLPILKAGLERLRADPDHFRQWNPENGWGDYEGLVGFTDRVAEACSEYPNYCVRVSR